MLVWRTLWDNSLLDLFMAIGVGSATGASSSGAMFASSSTHAPRAACSSMPYNSSGNFVLRVLCRHAHALHGNRTHGGYVPVLDVESFPQTISTSASR